jgi:hypothetical protein
LAVVETVVDDVVEVQDLAVVVTVVPEMAAEIGAALDSVAASTVIETTVSSFHILIQ